MDDKDLILLKTLYEEKNITHTAKRLFLSQPAITERIKRIEKEFDCTVILRQPRGILFTPEGEMLYAFAEQSLRNYQGIKERIAAQTDKARGSLTIGCSNVFAKYHMPSVLSKFKELYPDIEITMYGGFSHNLYRRFLEGDLHVVIARGNHNWNEHKNMLWQEPLCVFNRDEIDMDMLPELPFVHYRTDPTLQSVLNDWWYSRFQRPPKIAIEVDAMDTCMKLVQEGLGFTLLSDSCGSDTPHVRRYPLHQADGSLIMRQTWLYYRNNYHVLSSVKAFVDFMTSYSHVLSV